MNYKLLNLRILLGVILSFLLGCSNDTVVIEDYSQIEESEIGKTESYNQYRNVYFGDTHIHTTCLLYTSPSPRDGLLSRMPSSA